MTNDLLLKLQNIDKKFENVHALKKVNFELRKGEVHALLGSNGAGKSTLMKIISGAYQQDEGSIELGGKNVSLSTPQEATDSGISIVYQEFSLINDLSVAENIFINRYIYKRKFPPTIHFSELRKQAKEKLNEMGIEIDVNKEVSHLPVGEQQIVEIAKALSEHTKVLILDEPTSALNSKEIEELFKLIRRLKEKGVGIIYISHRLNELEKICDKVTVMRDGENIGTYPIGGKSIDELVDLMLGKARNAMEIKSDKNINKNVKILSVKQMYTNKLNDINLELSPGEIVGLAGQMGSGRTESLKAIFGLDIVKSGEIYLDGKQVSKNTPVFMIENGVGFVSEDRKKEGIFPGRSISENIVTTVMKEITKLYTIVFKRERHLSNAMIEKTGLHPPLPHRDIESLSGGNQQKAILGRWLALENLKVLLLDEPTRGIDVGAKAQIYSILDEISQKGVGIIIASSDADELVEVCNRVYVLNRGKVQKELKSSEITFSNLSVEVMGGTV